MVLGMGRAGTKKEKGRAGGSKWDRMAGVTEQEVEEGKEEEMPHSRYCTLLFLGNSCSRSALWSPQGFLDQPLELARAMTLPRDKEFRTPL